MTINRRASEIIVRNEDKTCTIILLKTIDMRNITWQSVIKIRKGGYRYYVMDNELKIKMYAFTVDCKEPYELAKFYASLLRWEIAFYDEEWACIGAPGAEQGVYPGITFQKNPQYEPPVWPEKSEAQQQMAHLDFAVNDLEKAVQYAVNCGATMAAEQFSDGWRVMIDPAGHPFCLCQMKQIMESDHFALL